MGAVVVIVVLVRRALDALPLLSLGPAFASLAGEVLYLLSTGGAALLVCLVLAVYRHLMASMPAILAFAAIAGVTAAGIIASAGVRRRKRETAELAAIAEVTQRVLLGPVPGEVGPVKLAVRYMSAAPGARVGGDLYETVAAEAGLRFILGDVQGKGLPAVLTAATVLGAFRESAYDAPSLDEIALRIEASLSRQPSTEQFVTALLAQVSADGTKVDLLNHGHPPPLLRSGGAVRFVEPGEVALPLGLADLAWAGGAPVRGEPVTVALGPGDCMLFYTDGISEARNAAGEFFPVGRSLAVADTTGPGTAGPGTAEPGTVLARLCDDVLRHVGHPLDDDAAMLLIRR